MRMAEKIKRSRGDAQRALDAYREGGGHDPDDQVAIGDLIADLLHLSDSLPIEAGADWPPLLLDRAHEDYLHESDPGNADEEV